MERECSCGEKYDDKNLKIKDPPCPICRFKQSAGEGSSDAFLRSFALGAAYADRAAARSVTSLYVGMFTKQEQALYVALIDPSAITEAKAALGLPAAPGSTLLALVLERLMEASAKREQMDFAKECVEQSENLTSEQFNQWLKDHGILKGA